MNGRQVIDVIRKNTMNSAVGIDYGAGDTPAPEFGPRGRRASPAGFGPPRTSSPAPGLNASPPLRTTPLSGRTYPNQHRYTLTDSGSGQSIFPGSTRPQSTVSRPSSRPPNGRVPSGPIPTNELATARPTKAGPTTFAEMGIQGAKAEEKDCVIM